MISRQMRASLNPKLFISSLQKKGNGTHPNPLDLLPLIRRSAAVEVQAQDHNVFLANLARGSCLKVVLKALRLENVDLNLLLSVMWGLRIEKMMVAEE
jgi:hypothetical protein